MQFKISSPEKVIFEGEVKQVSLPTEIGTITVLPNHAPMVTALKPWLIKILPTETPKGDFVFSENYISISVSKGMAFVDGKIIRVVTATATQSPKESWDTLLKMREELEGKIKQLKMKGSIEDIEKSLIMLEKIDADIKLEKLKRKSIA